MRPFFAFLLMIFKLSTAVADFLHNILIDSFQIEHNLAHVLQTNNQKKKKTESL